MLGLLRRVASHSGALSFAGAAADAIRWARRARRRRAPPPLRPAPTAAAAARCAGGAAGGARARTRRRARRGGGGGADARCLALAALPAAADVRDPARRCTPTRPARSRRGGGRGARRAARARARAERRRPPPLRRGRERRGERRERALGSTVRKGFASGQNFPTVTRASDQSGRARERLEEGADEQHSFDRRVTRDSRDFRVAGRRLRGGALSAKLHGHDANCGPDRRGLHPLQLLQRRSRHERSAVRRQKHERDGAELHVRRSLNLAVGAQLAAVNAVL